MNEVCQDHAVCLEKLAQVQKDVNDLDTRVDNVENKILSIDRTLSDRLLVLETTTKIGNENISNSIEKLSKKVDKIIDEREKDKTEMLLQPKKEDSFDIWLKRVGLKILEYSIYAGLTYGILKGFKII